MASSSSSFDVVVVGAGLAGLAAALGFARARLRVALVGPPERAAPGRTVALLGRSLDLLESLGVMGEIERAGAPLRTLRIVDDTGAWAAARPAEFRAGEIGREAFGWNVENDLLAPILAGALGAAARFEAEVTDFAFGADMAQVRLADGSALTAPLIVGADGRASPSRKAAGIDMTARRFDQTALTVLLRHSRPHDDASTEFHTREGPFTLVPLPPAADAPHRSSLVWLMRNASAARRFALGDAELAAEIRRGAHALLGEMAIEGGRGRFPMTIQRVARLTAPRLALIGDAAHAFPPIGAQGLNLGLRDAAAIVAEAARAGSDPGDEATLRRYEASRRSDIALRTFAVGALNAALLTPWAPFDVARGLGLTALAGIAPLRKLAMREGLNPFLAR